jgi:hypothetical protein
MVPIWRPNRIVPEKNSVRLFREAPLRVTYVVDLFGRQFHAKIVSHGSRVPPSAGLIRVLSEAAELSIRKIEWCIVCVLLCESDVCLLTWCFYK